MLGLLCRKWCKFHELEIESLPEPEMRSGSVRIAVHSAGVSFATKLWVEGNYQRKPGLPFIPGTEVSGVVVECAPGVKRCKPGDKVYAALDWGGMAEQVVADEVCVFPVPESVGMSAAVNLPVSYGTAYSSLIWRTGLKASETLLVFGAAGAVGLAAVRIAKAIGARVIACAGSEEKIEVLKRNGIDMVINYCKQDIRRYVLEFTDGKGADVIFDPVGGERFNSGLRSIMEGGRIIVLGFAGGNIQQIPANIIMVKNVSIIGFNYGKYIGWGLKDERNEYAETVKLWHMAILDFCDKGKIKPDLYKAFPLTEYVKAMDSVLNRKVIGKVVLRLSEKKH